RKAAAKRGASWTRRWLRLTNGFVSKSTKSGRGREGGMSADYSANDVGLDRLPYSLFACEGIVSLCLDLTMTTGYPQQGLHGFAEPEAGTPFLWSGRFSPYISPVGGPRRRHLGREDRHRRDPPRR